jgi:transcriptional regulator with XRE-family HTH domain
MVITKRYKLYMETRREAFRRALIYFIENGKNITQAKISAGTGIKQGMISGMKTGKRWGTEESRRAIAEYFGKQYEEFLSIGAQLIDAENALALQSQATPATGNLTHIDQQHADVIKKFQNRELALEINHILTEIERIDPDELRAVASYLKDKKYRLEHDQKKRPGTASGE